MKGFFPVVHIHRADLEDLGFDVSVVTDEKMERLAERMGEAFVECGFFYRAMEEIAGEMGIPRIEGINKRGFCTKCGCHVLTRNDDGSCVDDNDDKWPKKKVI